MIDKIGNALLAIQALLPIGRQRPEQRLQISHEWEQGKGECAVGNRRSTWMSCTDSRVQLYYRAHKARDDGGARAGIKPTAAQLRPVWGCGQRRKCIPIWMATALQCNATACVCDIKLKFDFEVPPSNDCKIGGNLQNKFLLIKIDVLLNRSLRWRVDAPKTCVQNSATCIWFTLWLPANFQTVWWHWWWPGPRASWRSSPRSGFPLRQQLWESKPNFVSIIFSNL